MIKIICIGSKLFPQRYEKYTSFQASAGFVAISDDAITLYLDARYHAAAANNNMIKNIIFKDVQELPRVNCVLDPWEWSIAQFKRFNFVDPVFQAHENYNYANYDHENCDYESYDYQNYDYQNYEHETYKNKGYEPENHKFKKYQAENYKEGSAFLNKVLNKDSFELIKEFLRGKKRSKYLITNFMNMKRPSIPLVLDIDKITLDEINFDKMTLDNVGINKECIFPLDEYTNDILFDPEITPLAYINTLNDVTYNHIIDPIRENDSIITDLHEYQAFLDNDALAWMNFWQDLEKRFKTTSEKTLLNNVGLQSINEKELGKAVEPKLNNVSKIQAFKIEPFKEELTNFSHNEPTEIDISNLLEMHRKLIHVENFTLAFETIVGNNERAAYIHGKPSDKIVQEGVLLIDAGSSVQHGSSNFKSDVTRVFLINKDKSYYNIHLAYPDNMEASDHNNIAQDVTNMQGRKIEEIKTEEIKTSYTNVLKAHIDIAKLQFAKDMPVCELDAIARQYVKFDHALGHAVGRSDVHAYPAISANSQAKLKEGMILAIEPGVYKENHYGIRLESQVRVVAINEKMFGFEYLTFIPFENDLIDFAQLSADQKLWISNFYQKCYDKLEGKIDEDFLKRKILIKL